MNPQCSICSDPLKSIEVIFSTPCGHIFHKRCLLKWLERSKTCPECRVKATDQSIHRIYFNVANTDYKTEDVGTLQYKIDSLENKLQLKEMDVRNCTQKYQKYKTQNFALKEEVLAFERNIKNNDSIVRALKDQISYFKSKCRDNENQSNEITQLKNRLKNVESVQFAIEGSREHVNELLRNENNAESLAILAAILKKTLVETERKKVRSDHRVKELTVELNKYRRASEKLERESETLKTEMAVLKANRDNEKELLTNMVKDLHKNGESSGHTPTIKRILNESPMPLARKHLVLADDVIVLNNSENSENSIIDLDDFVSKPPNKTKQEQIPNSFLSEKVKSPFMSPKVWMEESNQVRSDKSSRDTVKLKHSDKPLSIFRPSIKNPDLNVISKPSTSTNVGYDGLGGHSKIHMFPVSKPAPTGLKRYKSASDATSTKYRKLEPKK